MRKIATAAGLVLALLSPADGCIQVSCAGRHGLCTAVCGRLVFFKGQNDRALCFESRIGSLVLAR
jgi:hypothetical protein